MSRLAAAWLSIGLLALACAPAGAPAGASAPAAPTAQAQTAPAAKPAGASAPAPSAPPAPIEVEVALPSTTALVWPFVIVRDGPIGAQTGVKLDWTVVETDARSVQALVGGSVEFAEAAMDAVVRAADQGGDVVTIGGNINRPAYAVAARPEIQSWAELRGKKFAVTDLRGGSTILLKLLLQANGVRDGEYDLQPLGGTPNRYAALSNGVVDAAILGQPADFRALDEGYRILGYTSDMDYQFTTYAVRRSWAEQNREKTVRFLRAMVAAHHWLHDPANRAQAVEIGSRGLRTSTQELERTWDLYFRDNPGRVMPLNGEVNMPGIETVVRVLTEQGEIREGATAARFVDERYLQEALRPGS